MEAASEVAQCDGDTSGTPRGARNWQGGATKSLKTTRKSRSEGKFSGRKNLGKDRERNIISNIFKKTCFLGSNIASHSNQKSPT